MNRTLIICIFIFFNTLSFGQFTVYKNKKFSNSAFPLCSPQKKASIYISQNDHKVVQIASELFAEDINRVTSITPTVLLNQNPKEKEIVIVGTIGKSKLVDQLGEKGLIHIDSIKGGWERYLIQTVENPLPGVKKALVIAGSDARGTAYGVFTVSKAIGVSPWYWWADVNPEKCETLSIEPISFISKSPSVKYRGFFINDEGLGNATLGCQNDG